MLVYLFYFIPFYVYAAYRILYPVNNGMLTDLAVFHAGAAAQVFIIISFFPLNRRFYDMLGFFLNIYKCRVKFCTL